MSEEEKKAVDKKKIIIIISAILIFIFIIIVAIIKIKYSSSKQNIQKKGYFCEDFYQLKGDKCVLTTNKPFVLLGNINQDNEINLNDVSKLEALLDSNQFDDLSYVAADINSDGVVDKEDLNLLKSYVNDNSSEYNIASQKKCPMDKENMSNYLSDNQSDCIQVIVKDALKEGDNNNQLMDYFQEINTISRYLGIVYNPLYTEQSEETNEGLDDENNDNSDNTQDTIEQIDSSNQSVVPNVDTSTPSVVPRTNTSSRNSIVNSNTSSNKMFIGPNTSSTVNTSSYFSTGISPTTQFIDGIAESVEEQTETGKLYYINGSPITIEEIKIPSQGKVYNYKDNIQFVLRVNQKGTGIYYYNYKTYYGYNTFNGGSLEFVSGCHKVSINKDITLNVQMLSNNRYIDFNVYQDKNCHNKAIVAKYESNAYKSDVKYHNRKLNDKVVHINDNILISIASPEKNNKGLYNYKIRYSINNGQTYYSTWREYEDNILVNKSECSRIINGMNQLYNVDYNKKYHYGEITIYSDSKCKKIIKSEKT